MDLAGINTFLWVTGNIVVLVIFISAILFAVLYPILFDPATTSAGKAIWRAIFSVAGFGFLATIGIFIDGRVGWLQFPDDVEAWRPLLRVVIYGYIAYSFASLVVLLVMRKYWPERLKTAPPDEDTLNVKPRARG